MKKWLILGGTVMTMVGVWASFFMFVMSDLPDRPSAIQFKNTEETPADTSLDDRSAVINNDGKEEDSGEDDERVNAEAAEDKTELPLVTNGDGIGYGEGVPIDQLLEAVTRDE